MANTGYRRFLAAPEADGFAIDPAKVAADVQFDGIFVLRTSLSMSALAVVLRYRSLLSAIRSLFEMPCLLKNTGRPHMVLLIAKHCHE